MMLYRIFACVAGICISLPAIAHANIFSDKHANDSKALSLVRSSPRNGPAAKDPQLQVILDSIESVSPEFGSDLLIRLAENSRISDHLRKIKLLLRAFELGKSATQPLKRGRMPEFIPDSESGYLALAATLNMDVLSLRSRAVIDMVDLDPSRARELVAEIAFPELRPQSCTAPLTYDVSLFYEAVGKAGGKSLTEDDKRNEKALTLILPLVSNLRSHAQVIPAARLLVDAELSKSELSRAANQFAYSLTRISGDERGFVAVAEGAGRFSAVEAVAKLIASLDSKGVPSLTLLKALRSYLVTNFAGERCRDNVDPQLGLQSLPQAVLAFNQTFKQSIENQQITAINKDELSSAHIGAEPQAVAFWQNDGRNLLKELQQLRAAHNTESTAPERSSAWVSRFRDFESEVQGWQQGNLSSIAYFDEKSILYEALIDLSAEGDERSRTISDFVDFLELNSVQRNSAMEWFFEVNRLIMKSRKANFRNELIQSFIASRDPELNLYGRFELWSFPAPPARASWRKFNGSEGQ